MKIRHGFVSNSSSSSFTIPTAVLTPLQIKLIKDHVESSKRLNLRGWSRPDEEGHWWNIEEEDGVIIGWTSMDNFDMREFLEDIGINSNKIQWGN